MKKNLKTISAIAIFTLMTGCSSIQIQGVVRDKPTGNPISSATVTVGEDTTSTDAMGSYHLEISDINEAMIVNAPGYYIYTKTIGKDTIHDIDLMPRKSN